MRQEYSPFRSTVTFKPQPQCPDIDIYVCESCGRSYQALGYDAHEAPACCGQAARRLEPVPEEDFPEGYRVLYNIVGGLNNDAVRITWKCPHDVRPEWILLKTFTGSYLRYVVPKKKPPMVFALADEDAYVYCDKKVCERCMFRCKLGFVAYVFFSNPVPLLLEVPLNKVKPRRTARAS